MTINVDRTKAASLGLTQDDIMNSVIAATNSSITYNKKNFWIDPVSSNQYFVGVQYPDKNFQSIDDILQHPDHQPQAGRADPAQEPGRPSRTPRFPRRSTTSTCSRPST